jgi:hypothetical protein
VRKQRQARSGGKKAGSGCRPAVSRVPIGLGVLSDSNEQQGTHATAGIDSLGASSRINRRRDLGSEPLWNRLGPAGCLSNPTAPTGNRRFVELPLSHLAGRACGSCPYAALARARREDLRRDASVGLLG